MSKSLGTSWSFNKHQEMNRLAQVLVQEIFPPTIILLEGELGAGKTTFAQYFCKSLGVEERVTSPTFNLLNTYTAKNMLWKEDIIVHHVDLYRLKVNQAPQLEELLDIQGNNYLCLIEWSNLFDINWLTLSEQMGAKLYTLFFEYGDYETQRIIKIIS